MSNTVNLNRIMKAPVTRVFRAFSNSSAVSYWLPPFGFICQVHEFDFKVGGHYKMSFVNFTNEAAHSFGGTFDQIISDKLLVRKDRFDDPNFPGDMTTTFSFKEVLCGTELTIKQEGIPDFIPVEMCTLGWQESLLKLTQLVEPEINH